jgi:hypothetical protein
MDALAALLALVGVGVSVAGARQVGRALRRANALALIYGIRTVILGAVAMLCAAGVAFGQTGLFVLAAVFLAEELYETALVAAIIRSGER